jgi:hypothetical protein
MLTWSAKSRQTTEKFGVILSWLEQCEIILLDEGYMDLKSIQCVLAVLRGMLWPFSMSRGQHSPQKKL